MNCLSIYIKLVRVFLEFSNRADFASISTPILSVIQGMGGMDDMPGMGDGSDDEESSSGNEHESPMATENSTTDQGNEKSKTTDNGQGENENSIITETNVQESAANEQST